MITSNIDHISSTKFQGLIIDEMLSWKNPINQLMSVLNSACFAVRAVNAITSQETLRKISFSCIHCVMINGLTRSVYLLTYLLTPWCRVLLEKLTGLQLVKKFPAFHGTRRFITALTSVRHLSLSWASPIQSI